MGFVGCEHPFDAGSGFVSALLPCCDLVSEPFWVVDAAAKAQALTNRRDQLGIARGEVLAVGDGANDAPMIGEAGLGISYRGKPKLEAIAAARIRHNDLTALLWAQGIPKVEWAKG